MVSIHSLINRHRHSCRGYDLQGDSESLSINDFRSKMPPYDREPFMAKNATPHRADGGPGGTDYCSRAKHSRGRRHPMYPPASNRRARDHHQSVQQSRVVNITRKRPGNAVPVTRTYNVRPNSKIDLPFRGPGRSRITSELPCKGDPGAPENLVDPDRG